jgi:hypothetical protein
MIPLIPPLHVAKMPFIWGNIVATPPGHYKPIRIYSFYIKNIEEGVYQGLFGEGQENRPKQNRAFAFFVPPRMFSARWIHSPCLSPYTKEN